MKKNRQISRLGFQGLAKNINGQFKNGGRGVSDFIEIKLKIIKGHVARPF
jgi:hypothetical protein